MNLTLQDKRNLAFKDGFKSYKRIKKWKNYC